MDPIVIQAAKHDLEQYSESDIAMVARNLGIVDGSYNDILWQIAVKLHSGKTAGMVKADLRGADLRFEDLQNKNFEDSDFRGADLRRVDLIDSNLKNANLKGADLKSGFFMRANFEGANLEGARLSYANLEDADLSFTNLKKANLKSANLTNANLSFADLSKCYLSKYTVLEGAKLLQTVVNSESSQYRILFDLIAKYKLDATLIDEDGDDLTFLNYNDKLDMKVSRPPPTTPPPPPITNNKPLPWFDLGHERGGQGF